MSEKVLVIDDDIPLLKLVKLSLEKEDYQVITAENGAQGLRQAFNTQPDLVLLDVMMPHMDGWEALSRLRVLSDLPVIILTGKNEHADVVKGLNMGADDYVAKPFDTDVLLARVAAVLRRARPSVPTNTTTSVLWYN